MCNICVQNLQNTKKKKKKKKKIRHKQSDILFLHTGRLNTVKISIPPNYRFKTIPLQISGGIFIEIDKLILKFVGTSKETRISKSILEKE